MGDNRVPRDPQLPTHWFNILHDRPQYVTSAVSSVKESTRIRLKAGHLGQPLANERRVTVLTFDHGADVDDVLAGLAADRWSSKLR